MKRSKAKIYLEREGDKITVKSNDCPHFERVIWQVNDGHNWIILKTKERSIDYLGEIAYFVEALCGDELMQTAENYSIIKKQYGTQSTKSFKDKITDLASPVRTQHEWHFEKLPESKYSEAITAYNDSDYKKLKQLHDTYQLSTNEYCCGYAQIMLNYFKKAIEDGSIY